MNEREFMALVGSLRGIGDPRFLDIPLEETPFDSLDLLALRAALETHLGRNLSGERFRPKSTLRDLYELVAR